MNAIKPFIFEDQMIRVHMINGEPWWLLADLCRVLGIANARDAASRLDDDEKSTVASTDGAGGPDRNIISESGMYALVFTSRKDVAKRFRKWVTSEVLPTLRKTGRYEMHPAAPAEPVDLTMEPLSAKVAAVRVAAKLFGRARARALWDMLGLPTVPVVALPTSEGRALLARLMDHPVDDDQDGETIAEALHWVASGAEDPDWLTGALNRRGVRLMDRDGVEGFVIANHHPGQRAIFGPGQAIKAASLLRGLPDAVPGMRARFDGQQLRCVWLPMRLIDQHLAAQRRDD